MDGTTERLGDAAKVTEKDLRRMLRYWQKRLRLSDWQCTIRFASLEELEGDQGRNEWHINARTSDIWVLNPLEYDPAQYGGRLQDIEDTVVHELNHLHLAGWNTKSKAELVQMEQAIESISGALVALKRRTKNVPTAKAEPTPGVSLTNVHSQY